MGLGILLKITLVMATHNPDLSFFEEQLKSIENQTYKDIELIILDDFSCSNKYASIQQIADKVLIKTSFSIGRNEENIGSNKTFEKLVSKVSGDYIGFCDQDDIYLSSKYETLIRLIEIEGAALAYSDSKVIDAYGSVVSNSFKGYARRIRHLYGENLGGEFIRRNCVTGCTMLVRRDIVEKALPFPESSIFVHDHWIAFVATSNGRITYSKQPLVLYRLHGNNQIGNTILPGVRDKRSYLDNKLRQELRKYEFVLERCDLFDRDVLNMTQAHIRDISSRIKFFESTSFKNFFQVLKFRKIDWELFVFECSLSMSPLFLQHKLIDMVSSRNIS